MTEVLCRICITNEKRVQWMSNWLYQQCGGGARVADRGAEGERREIEQLAHCDRRRVHHQSSPWNGGPVHMQLNSRKLAWWA